MKLNPYHWQQPAYPVKRPQLYWFVPGQQQVKLARKTHVESRKSLKSSGSTFAFVGVHFGVLEGRSRINKNRLQIDVDDEIIHWILNLRTA